LLAHEERMGKKHHSHSHHKHDGFGDHHHGGHGFLVGTRGNDILEGTDKSDVIIGRKGNDALFGKGANDWLDGGKGNDELHGGDGNDWLFGGKGKDLLDGGAGSDKVFGGKGNDIAVYSLAENSGTDACGKDTHDFYDGGKGHDVLQLILTPEELASDAVKADIAAFEAFLAENGSGCGSHGKVFEFTSFDLTVRNFEALEVISGNTPPVANGDSYSTLEDTPLVVPAAAGVLSNDTDADGNALSAAIVVGPSHGALTFNDDGSFSYNPDKDYNGPDGFSYLANDGTDDSEFAAEVLLTVLEKNDPPVAGKDSASVGENSVNNVIDVLANDVPGPANESAQSLEVVFAFSINGGDVTVNPDDYTLWYTPPPDFTGDDRIQYLVRDDGTTAGLEDPLAASGEVLVHVGDVDVFA
jgi:hypothetical protein